MSHTNLKSFCFWVIIKVFQLLLGSWIIPLNAVQVELLENKADSSLTNKAYVQFTFEPDDSALFKDTIKISADSPTVQVIKWKMLSEPTSKYFAAFRTNKRVFTQTCTAKITLSSLQSTDIVTNPHLAIYGIKQSVNGKNSPFSYIISLAQEKTHDHEFILSTSSELFPSTTHSLASTHTAYSNMFHDQLTQEFQLLEKLSAIWKEIIQLIKSFFYPDYYVWWYALLWLFFVGLLCIYFIQTLRSKLIDKLWFTQGFECLILVLVLSSLPLATLLLKRHSYVYLAGCTLAIAFIGFFCLELIFF